MTSVGVLSPWTRHPRSVGESYLQHLCSAGKLGLLMGRGALACLIHAVLPFLFADTASRCVRRLHAAFKSRRTAVGPY
ncbi:MAG: DUF6356 family protein [Steroidobacteraceae bacterium]